MKTLRVGFFIILIFATLAWVASTAHAAPTTGLNLQVSPLPILLQTTPGGSASADLRVRNAGTTPEKLKITLLSFASDQQGTVKLTELSPSDDQYKWAHLSQTTFDAPPGEWQTIKLTINPPKTAAFGYYYAVRYSRVQEVEPKPGEAAYHGAVATFVLVDVKVPGAKREANIASFSADRQFYEFLPTTFNVKIQNTGNLHLSPQGSVYISQGGKNNIAVIPINDTQGNVLPNSTRTFSGSWDAGFPVYVTQHDASGNPIKDKNGNVKKTLNWDFSKVNHLRVGHYTAKLVMVYDNGTRDVPLTATVSFWVIPWRLIVLVIFFPALAAYLFIRNRRLHRQIKRMSDTKS